ncbi:MAG TPA: Trk system potassium transporter TrkA [Candidatus Glassbacteria bacterium]|nr:Trk system potassium transporter TrkA [Candidatus Glassbacteria bacterium]
MRAIIIGAGDVGFQLASRLSQQGEEIVVVDLDQDKVDRVEDHLDVIALLGSGVDFRILEKAGIANSDTLIAVSDDDEVNILACQLAQRYDVQQKLARVGAEYYYGESPLARDGVLGVDVMVNPEQACANEIQNLLNVAAATDVVEFADGEVILVGMKIGPRFVYRDTPLRRIAGEFEKHNFLVTAISRGDQTIIPSGEDVIHEGDLLYVIGKSDDTGEMLGLAGYENRKLQRVMFAGGTPIAVRLAGLLEASGATPIIFEADRNRCAQLAERLSASLVLNGDATDLDLLQSEGVDGVDGFVALTEDDENNIISSLVAKNLGAHKTIALIKRLEYLTLATRVGVDAAVSPHLATVNAILAATHSERLLALATLRGMSVQIMEVSVRAGLHYVGRPLKDLTLPAACIIGSVVRNGATLIPHGDDCLEPGDKVVVFTLDRQAHKVSKFFL